MDPQTFGKYHVVRRLAGGGMGRVFFAEDTQANRPVALKLIDIGTDQDSRDILEAERRGAALHARLCGVDSRVAQIYEFGEHQGYFFIAMEYVNGQDLSEILTGGPLEPGRAVGIAIALCEVLSNAHSFRAMLGDEEYHGIVHGDIKPRNIRLTDSDGVKILDFGIAKALSLTRDYTRNVFGSVPYASPERLNTGEVDEASDVWSVGVVLYEMLRGKPYFHSTNGSVEHLIRSYRVLPPTLLEVPVGLRQILGKALSPDPELRYTSADAFRSDLLAFRDGRPLSVANESAAAANGTDDATRRTFRAAAAEQDDEGATRRTTPSAKPATPAMPASTPVAKMWRNPLSRRQRLIFHILFFGAIGLGFWNEWYVWRSGSQLKSEIESERLKDFDQAWSRYDSLLRRSYLPAVLSGPRNALKNRLVSVADRVITDYRESESVIVKEGDWQKARVALSRALQIDPGDKQIRGRLRLAEGHISRINANGRNQGKSWNDAKAQLEEAKDLMRGAPDADLALARLYIYGFQDIEKAEKELREAEKRGYKIGKREKAQLADGYRVQGDSWMREATRSRGMPQEGEYLQRADESYSRAESLYEEAVPFANSSLMLRRMLASRDLVAMRFQAMRKND